MRIKSTVLKTTVLIAVLGATSSGTAIGQPPPGPCTEFYDWRESDQWPNPDDWGHTADPEKDPNTWDPGGEWYQEGTPTAYDSHYTFEAEKTIPIHEGCTP